jgi:hypothetical protein
MRILDELAPFRLFAADALGKGGGRTGERFEILRVEKVLLHLRLGKNGANLGIDFVDYAGGNARRAE